MRTKLIFQTLLAIAIVLMSLACGKEQENIQGSGLIDRPAEAVQSFGEYEALRAEVLVPERTHSLVKYVKFQRIFLAGFGETIELELSIFLHKNGKAVLFADWVYPEELETGGIIRRTSHTVVDTKWLLNNEGIEVGEDKALIHHLASEGEEFTGYLRPQFLGPPPGPRGKLVHNPIEDLACCPLRFDVVSEVLEATIVERAFY